jgi:hypothetical protein
MYQILTRLTAIFLKTIRVLFKSKKDLLLENLALRQQLVKYQARNIKPKLTDFDRSFWVALKQVWAKWFDSLIIV